MWRRYEYDGLNLLRMAEKYDTAGGSLDINDPWRTIEVNTHKPGSLGALIGKRVCVYNAGNYTDTPNSTNDYTYAYDALGNVQAVFRASGITGEPLIITQNGEAKAVIQDIQSYEQTQETMALLKILSLGVRQVEEGRIQPAGDVIDRIRGLREGN